MSDTSDEQDMHRQVEWMTPADVAILQLMSNCRDNAGNPAILTPKIISLNTGFHRKHIGKRLRTLNDHDLIDKEGRGEYRLTGRGESLLNGGIEPSELNGDSE